MNTLTTFFLFTSAHRLAFRGLLYNAADNGSRVALPLKNWQQCLKSNHQDTAVSRSSLRVASEFLRAWRRPGEILSSAWIGFNLTSFLGRKAVGCRPRYNLSTLSDWAGWGRSASDQKSWKRLWFSTSRMWSCPACSLKCWVEDPASEYGSKNRAERRFSLNFNCILASCSPGCRSLRVQAEKKKKSKIGWKPDPPASRTGIRRPSKIRWGFPLGKST